MGIKAQNEKIIKVGANSENIQNLKNGKINNQNQIKNSKPLIEDTIKKKAMKRTIEESIAVIRNQNKCSNQLANQAINKFLQQQEKKMEKVILEKLMNLEILQNNRDILENKINIQNKEMEPADIAYPEDVYDPDNIENHNKDQEVSFNLDNVVSKILEFQITRKINKANERTSGEPNNDYIKKTDARDYIQNKLNKETNKEYIEKTNERDYVQHKLNKETNKEYIEKADAHNYVKNKLDRELNSEYTEKTDERDYVQHKLNKEPNKEYIEKTDARDYARNVLNIKPNSEYIKETNAHVYVQNKLNTESARDEKSGDTVNLDCTKNSKEDHQITFDLEHVLSKTLDSRNNQKGT